jgi:voltage-gated potassium channel
MWSLMPLDDLKRGAPGGSGAGSPNLTQIHRVPRGLIIGVAALIVLIGTGSIGFIIAGLSPVDAVLAAVSAITTVGYFPSQLSTGAKLFATALILVGVGASFYVLGSLTEFLVEGGLRGTWRQRRMERDMEQLVDHYIISGFGRVGQRAATQLGEKGSVPFVVVDTNPATIAVAHHRGLLYLEGDATKNVVLEAVGVRRAQGLLACADSDVNNVYVTLSARTLNPDLYIVARAGDPDAEQKLYAAGASRVVSPYTMAGNRMAHLAIQPLAADYIDVVIRGQNLGVQIEERVIPPRSTLENRTVGDIRRRELAGGHVLAVEHDQQLITFVDDTLVLVPGDRVLVAGTAEQVAHFDESFGKP